jgi:hypothetical protein
MTANLNSIKSKISAKIINPKKSFLKSIGPLYLHRIGYHQNAAQKCAFKCSLPSATV